MNHPSRIALVGVVQIASLTGSAAAAHAGPDQAPIQPLSGPTISDQAMRSLVHRDMQGRFQRVEGRPEVAAIAQIPIDPVRRAEARRVVEDRAAALRSHLVEHIEMIRASTDASLAGDTEKVRRIQYELYQLFDPTGERSPLLAPLAGVLSRTEYDELARVVDECWDAWIAAESDARMMDSGPPDGLESRLVYELYQRELAYAYEDTLRPFQQRLDRIYAVVEPTDEQRAAIRGAVIKYIGDAKLTPTAEQREELARTIYDALDEPRRFRLFAAGLAAM